MHFLGNEAIGGHVLNCVVQSRRSGFQELAKKNGVFDEFSHERNEYRNKNIRIPLHMHHTACLVHSHSPSRSPEQMFNVRHIHTARHCKTAKL